MTFLKILLVLVGIYYLAKWAFRAMFGQFLANIQKQAEQFQQQYQQQYPNQGQQKPDLDTKNQSPSVDSEVGEYIDYEEV